MVLRSIGHANASCAEAAMADTTVTEGGGEG